MVFSSNGASMTGMGSPASSRVRSSPSMGRETAITCAPGCASCHSLITSRALLRREKGISLNPSRRISSRGRSSQVLVASASILSLYLLYFFEIYSSSSNRFPFLSANSYIGIYRAGTESVPSDGLAILKRVTVLPMPPSPRITTFLCSRSDQLSLMISHTGQLTPLLSALSAGDFPIGSICLYSLMFGYSRLSISSAARSWKLGWLLRFCFSTSVR